MRPCSKPSAQKLFILREAPLKDIRRSATPALAEAVRRLRCKEVSPSPGYDGAYGKIELLNKNDLDAFSGQFSFPGLEQLHPPKKGPAPPSPPQKEEAMRASHTTPPPHLPYGLNQEQFDAAFAREKTIAVLAGPGTGKTKNAGQPYRLPHRTHGRAVRTDHRRHLHQ